MQDPEDPVQRYLDLRRQLLDLRKKTGDVDCPEEDALLDEMDGAWSDLTPEQIRYVESASV